MGACFQHCVCCNEEQSCICDRVIARSTLRFLLRGLECVHVLEEKPTGGDKKLKAEVITLKRSGHSGGTNTTKHKRGRTEPKWKRERDKPTTPPGVALHTVGYMGREVTQEQNIRAISLATRWRLTKQRLEEATLDSHRAWWLRSPTNTIKVTHNELNLEIVANLAKMKINVRSTHQLT